MLLTRWKIGGFDELTYKRLMTSDSDIPTAYELTKIHNPLKIIVSFINIYFFFLIQHHH